jgi:polyhydroxyalkanoate synthesis regulator phasin
MKFNRWLALPVALLAAIAIGVAAVEAAPSPSPSAGTTGKNYAQVFVDKLAAILGLSPAKTQDALKQAELQTVDQMVADGKITKAQGDALKARINAGQGLGPIGGFGFRRGPAFGGRAAIQGLMMAELNAAASALHMSPTDLMNALRSGKTLSDLETQQKVSDSAVKTAIKNAAKAVLDQAVKAGTITQAQEDAALARIESGKLGGFGFGRGFKHGAPQPGQSPNQSPAATPAAYFSTI